MDAEKAEKSTNDQSDNSKTDEEQSGEKGKGIEFNKVSSSKSFSRAAPKPEQIEIEPNPIKEEAEHEEDQAETEANTEESSPAPPDLAKVSEEIDQFISSLSKTQNASEKSAAPPDLPICVEQFVVLVEAKIEEYDSGESHLKWSKLKEEEAAAFLEIVNRLSSLSKELSKFASEYKYAGSLNRVGGILQRTMSYLEEGLKALLEDCNPDNNNNNNSSKSDVKTPLKQSSSIKNQEPAAAAGDPIPQETEKSSGEENSISGYSESKLSDLIKLSHAMIAGGYETECCRVYFVARRNALEDGLAKLGFEKHSMDELHRMQWESLEKEIETWLRTFKECATVHFSSERKLCDTIFKDNPSLSPCLFGGLCRGLLFQILNFAGAVVLTKRSVDKMFKYVAIYEALRDVVPSMDKLFPEESLVELKFEAQMIRSRIGEMTIMTLSDFESSIKADLAKNQVPGGAVHPLNIYVMDYLENICEHSTTLDQIFNEHQRMEPSNSTAATESEKNTPTENKNNSENHEEVKNSPFQEQILIIMDLLDANIDGKAKHYKDTSLSSIFMMNNGRYMLKKIRGCAELNGLMSDTWYRKKSGDLRQYHKGYQRDTWGKLLNCFTPEGLTSHGKVAKPVLKERFKSFNALFDEIHKTQSNWVVGDEQLQSELRVSISNMVVPAYRSFLGRYSQTFTPGRQTEKYVKYQPEDIETYIDELFDGTAAPMGRKKL